MNVLQTTKQDIKRQLWNKVPAVTAMFWIVKILCTTIGETAADFLNFNLHVGLIGTTGVMALILAILLTLQIKSEKYNPTLYWLSVMFISILGTLITDTMTDLVGIPLWASSIVFSLALAGVFVCWHRREGTLSVQVVNTYSRELFYWLAILVTFALGTALGDLAAEYFSLGYALSGALFAVLIGIIYAVSTRYTVYTVGLFWSAYILTRPLGASIGDYLSQPYSVGGLGMGTAVTSLVFLIAIGMSMVYSNYYQKQ